METKKFAVSCTLGWCDETFVSENLAEILRKLIKYALAGVPVAHVTIKRA